MHGPGTCTCCSFLYYEQSAKYIESQLEKLDDKDLKEKLTPKGASRKISKEPKEVELNEEEFDEAIDLFYDLMDTFIHLLHALPVGAKITSGDPLYEDLEGDWEWYYDEYYYHETEEEIKVDESKKDILSLEFLDLILSEYLINTTVNLILEKITIQRWTKNNREYIRNNMVAEYLLGIGGKNVIDITDMKDLKKLVKTQWSYFQKFAEEIKNGELSGARILQRISMYGEAITNGYEQANAKSHGIKLPEYPADGNQQCWSNCRCHWELADDPKNSNYVLATWKMNPDAEHCISCIGNSKKWNPLRVIKNVP